MLRALLPALLVLLAGCSTPFPDPREEAARLARDVAVPGGGSLVASGGEGTGPQGGAPYVGYAHHRYAPEANASRLVSLTAALLADNGWTMGPLQILLERTPQDGNTTAFFTVGERGERAIEVRAGRYEGGACCTPSDDPATGILLLVRVRA